jgi:hypothetical protein
MKDKIKTQSPIIRVLAKLRRRVDEMDVSTIECCQAKTESERANKCKGGILGTLSEPFPVPGTSLKILSVDRSFYNMFNVAPRESVGNFVCTKCVKNKRQKGSGYDLCS